MSRSATLRALRGWVVAGARVTEAQRVRHIVEQFGEPTELPDGAPACPALLPGLDADPGGERARLSDAPR